MTIPSIKMTESRAGDAGTQGAAGVDPGTELNAGSFASFLGDEAGGSAVVREQVPAASLSVNVVPGRVRVMESAEESPISENSNVRTTVIDQGGLSGQRGAAGVVRPENGVRGSAVGGTKNGASGRGKAEGGAGPKKISGTPAAQVMQDSAPATVVTPVAGDAVRFTTVAAPAALSQGVGAFDVPARDQTSGQEVAAGVDVGPSAEKQTAAAIAQVPQPSEVALSSTTEMQTIQPQPDAWDDMVQSVLPEAAPGEFPQKNTHVPSIAADKTSRPADSDAITLDSPLVAEPAQGDANQLPYHALSGSVGEKLTVDAGRDVEPPADLDAVSVSGVGLKKSDVHAERGASSLSPAAQPTGAAAISATSTFGMALSRQFRTSTLEGDLHQSLSGTPALSASEQFAIERRQTLGAARALGDALQSTTGLGVQTESFGRVTIHTATEGNHLLAQVTLEDGRQSAALVSHVPAVEQRLAQQLGLQAAVSVSTGAQTASGGLSGDGEAPQQRRGAGETKAEKGRTESVSVHEVDDRRTPSQSGAGRIDVTV